MLIVGQVLMSKYQEHLNPLKGPQDHHQISPLQVFLQYARSPEDSLPVLGLLPIMIGWGTELKGACTM